MPEFIDFPEGKLTVGPPDGIVITYDLQAMRAFCEEKGIGMGEISPEDQKKFANGSFYVGTDD